MYFFPLKVDGQTIQPLTDYIKNVLFRIYVTYNKFKFHMGNMKMGGGGYLWIFPFIFTHAIYFSSEITPHAL